MDKFISILVLFKKTIYFITIIMDVVIAKQETIVLINIVNSSGLISIRSCSSGDNFYLPH